MSDDDDRPEIDMEAVERLGRVRRGTYLGIGEFIFQFSQLEFTIKVALSAYLKLPDGYFDVVTGPYDFRMLCAVTNKVAALRYPDQKEEFEKIYKECQSLNDKRVHIAHGLWTDGLDEFSVRVFSRTKLDATHYPYSVDELNELTDKAQELMKRVVGFKDFGSD